MCASSCIKQYVQPLYGCRGMPVQGRRKMKMTGGAKIGHKAANLEGLACHPIKFEILSSS